MRLPRTRSVLTAVTLTLALALASLVGAPSAAAAPAAAAPVVTLSPTEGTIGVSCGPLPSATARFEVTLWRSLGHLYVSPRTTTLPPGATSTTLTGLSLGRAYGVSCQSRDGRTSGPASAKTPVLYPDLTLPVLRVDTAGAAPVVSRDDYLSAAISVDPNGQASVPALAASAKIRGRGNSTWDAPTPKKPYKLKLDKAAPLLGLPANKSWALLANYYDKTMLRTTIAYTWGRASSLAWTPRTAYVELVLNGDYRGVYQLSETPDVDPSRVAIEAMKDTDNTEPAISGGYLAEIEDKAGTPYDKPGDVPSFSATRSGARFTIQDPDPATPEQTAYLKGQVDTAESDLVALSQGDTAAYARLGSELDLISFADWYVVSEMSRNYDSWYSSTYLYKPRGGKLTMGPLWDFDLSMGTYFFTKQRYDDAWVRSRSPWFDVLLGSPGFRQLVLTRYAALRPTIASTSRTIHDVDDQIDEARVNDAVRWGYASTSASGEVRDLQSWLDHRLDWFDRTYPPAR